MSFDHDAWLTEADPQQDEDLGGLRDANHGRCPVCKADICLAGLPENIGRENCPCDGEGAEPVVCVDGQEVCSLACQSTYEAGQ